MEQVNGYGTVVGSPLVSPEIITIYFLVFFLLLTVLYIIFHYIKKPLQLKHKLKLVILISIGPKVAFSITFFALLSFWLLPQPRVTSTSPNMKEISKKDSRIEVFFDRPVDRASLQKFINPDVAGVWVFEDSLYSTHLYRKVVFHPTTTFAPDTTYTVSIRNITNLIPLTNPSSYIFSFKSQKSPRVASVTPQKGSKKVEITMPIKVSLSSPNEDVSEFDFKLNPSAKVNVSLDKNKKLYTLTPLSPLLQGVKYSLSIKKTNVIRRTASGTITQRGNTVGEYEGFFTTKEAPGIESFTPTGEKVLLGEPISMVFSAEMDRASVENNFLTTPKLSGSFTWLSDKVVTFKPYAMQFETSYQMKIPQGTKDKFGGFIPSDITKSFTTIGRVRVENIYPSSDWKGVGVGNQIKVTFDQEVDRQSAVKSFVLTPAVVGSFSWDANTLIFTPTSRYPYNTEHTVIINAGVKSINGMDSKDIFVSKFTSEDEMFKLAVPAYLQKYSLSCEIAALQMALEFKGVKLDEDTIISQVGIDNTPRKDGIWGDPHAAFVGNVSGRQMINGYGVYWEPIARVARNYRQATDFRGWGIGQLTHQIASSNPVVIWVYSTNGSPVSWNTQAGKSIFGVRGEHAVVAVGFVGVKDNPSAIIVNDPLIGQVVWPRAYFDAKWKTFSQSGVVIY